MLALHLQKVTCLVPRCLSFDENMRAKEGGKETTGETALRLPSVPFPWSLAVHHQSLAFRARFCQAKNEAPEEEAGKLLQWNPVNADTDGTCYGVRIKRVNFGENI